MRPPTTEPILRFDGNRLRALHDDDRLYVQATTRRQAFIAVAYLPGVPGRYRGDLTVEYGTDSPSQAAGWMRGCHTRYGPTTRVWMFRYRPDSHTYDLIGRYNA